MWARLAQFHRSVSSFYLIKAVKKVSSNSVFVPPPRGMVSGRDLGTEIDDSEQPKRAWIAP